MSLRLKVRPRPASLARVAELSIAQSRTTACSWGSGEVRSRGRRDALRSAGWRLALSHALADPWVGRRRPVRRSNGHRNTRRPQQDNEMSAAVGSCRMIVRERSASCEAIP
jgi:hypothetical protein